jgi:phosphoribosyl 1,2-cyclic phosphodiesterase/ActR/RegA family two-component response regulator
MKTVLLIDEDAATRRFIKRLLTPDGWDIWEAQDAAAGLALAIERQPQMVVFDLLLRGGIQLGRDLRANPNLPQIKLIAISARDYPDDRQSAKDAGAEACLAKPLDPIRFKKLLDRLANGIPGEDAAQSQTMLPPDAPTRLKFWGVRGSIPAPGRETIRFGGNTTCVEVRAEGELIILDAGSGIRPLGLALTREFQGKPLEMTLLITHTHWDHIQGFPFFVPAYSPRNTLHVLGYEGASRSLQETLSGQMESPYFPIGLKEMPGSIIFSELRDLHFSVGRVRVQASYVNHPGICVGYRLFTRDGSITFIPDNEQYVRLKSSPADPSATTPDSLEYARHQDQKLIEFIRNSDVLIADSQYDAQEYAAHVGWGHSCVDDSVTLALRAGVKHLYLFHHDPAHSDDKLAGMVRHAREFAAAQGGDLTIEAAREGVEVVLRQTIRKRSRPRKD